METNSMEPFSTPAIYLATVLSIIGAYLTWKYAHLFLSRQDYYRSSKYELLKKKLNMCLGTVVTIWVFIYIAVNPFLIEGK